MSGILLISKNWIIDYFNLIVHSYLASEAFLFNRKWQRLFSTWEHKLMNDKVLLVVKV